MIAYCGLLCDTCPIHLATIENDKLRQRQMRSVIAKECLKRYGMELQIDDIGDCDGCRASSGRLFSGCLTCEVRKCAISRKVESCAFCDHYVCTALRERFIVDPDAQRRLEKMRIN